MAQLQPRVNGPAKMHTPQEGQHRGKDGDVSKNDQAKLESWRPHQLNVGSCALIAEPNPRLLSTQREPLLLPASKQEVEQLHGADGTASPNHERVECIRHLLWVVRCLTMFRPIRIRTGFGNFYPYNTPLRIVNNTP